jgi:hypothetical protein
LPDSADATLIAKPIDSIAAGKVARNWYAAVIFRSVDLAAPALFDADGYST